MVSEAGRVVAWKAAGAERFTERPTLCTYALAAAGGDGSEQAAGADAVESYLSGHQAAACGDADSWHAGLRRYLERPSPADEPLFELASTLDLQLLELLAIALAAAIESDLMAGRALARLQAPVGGSRPTLGLLATCLAPVSRLGDPIAELFAGRALETGLLKLLGDGAPLAERPVAVPLHLCFALRGADGRLAGGTIGLAKEEAVPLPPSCLRQAKRQAGALAGASEQALVVRSGSPAERRSVAAALAQTLELRPLFLAGEGGDGLGPWLLSRRLLPVFCCDLGPGERRVLPRFAGYAGPMLALCGPEGGVETARGGVLEWVLEAPAPGERLGLWRHALGDGELAAELARDHRHSTGRIAHLSRMARHRSRLEGRRRPCLEDVAAAAWIGEGGGLETLAQPLPEPIPERALVASPALQRELETLLLRCRHRDRLVDGLGVCARARYRPGVKALLVGPSGTGKTLATGWLATRLGMPLYRVDLASVTSKYVGETEKNLAQLLARAEESEVILLFDEADSLFGKRTEIKDANDRFANTQTNYLLQRIETFDGIAILTSNSRGRFDPAFTRRLDLVLDFPLPSPGDRRRLWRAHLGSGHRLSASEVNRLAGSADLCGGHIRNIVLQAAVRARSENRPIEAGDVLRGLVAEYRKLGKQVPEALKVRSRDRRGVPARERTDGHGPRQETAAPAPAEG